MKPVPILSVLRITLRRKSDLVTKKHVNKIFPCCRRWKNGRSFRRRLQRETTENWEGCVQFLNIDQVPSCWIVVTGAFSGSENPVKACSSHMKMSAFCVNFLNKILTVLLDFTCRIMNCSSSMSWVLVAVSFYQKELKSTTALLISSRLDFLFNSLYILLQLIY